MSKPCEKNETDGCLVAPALNDKDTHIHVVTIGKYLNKKKFHAIFMKISHNFKRISRNLEENLTQFLGKFNSV